MKGNITLQINTVAALFASLQMKQFKFESWKGQNKEDNILTIINTLQKCKIITVKKKKWYRARKISDNDENILYNESGIPIRSYNSEQSGVAPAICISEGRANDKFEQVLYVAEDKNTALREIHTSQNGYASLAYCNLNRNIKLLDFSPYSNNDLAEYTKKQFKNDIDTGVFIEMQRILTLAEYSEDQYVISRKLVRLIKENIDVAGMLYISHYTGKRNVAIWDDNKYTIFSEGKVVHGV